MEKKLHRIPDQAVFGGVASGIAQYLQIDVVIVRVLFVVMLFLPIPPSFGWTGILYIILWAVLPTGSADVHNFDTIANKPHDPEADKRRSDQTVKILGGALVLFGIFMLVDDFPIWYEIKPYFWPVALIIVGAFLILRQRDKEHEANTTVYPTTPPPTEPIEPDPFTPTPDPQPYTPFGTIESTPPNTFPQDPNNPKENGDDDIIKVN
jgi:phage shock protein PspC (stress-responsive transcriptional regulator)